MPLRVGIDLVRVEDVARAVRESGDRYLRRIYTEQEVADCRTGDGAGVDEERLAARFAAKEAAIKVLRPDDQPVPWRDIEIRRMPGGWTALELDGRAAALARDAGLEELAVSLTHEQGFASAVVIAEVPTRCR